MTDRSQKYRNGWFYYAGTRKTYHIDNGTCLMSYRGYYQTWYRDAQGGYWKLFPQITKECPI